MNLVMQPTPETCGQACTAMITGNSVEDVIRDMKTSGPTSVGQLIEALDRCGVRHAERNTRISKKKGLYLAGVECPDDAQSPEGWSK